MSQPQVKIHDKKNGFTSLKSAHRSAFRGRARWRLDGRMMPQGWDPIASGVALNRCAIDFISDESDYRAVSVANANRLREIGYDRDVAQGAMASLDAIKGLPLAGNVVRLLTVTRRRAVA